MRRGRSALAFGIEVMCEMNRKYKLMGSLTVEAALLMPVIFLVVFMSIYLTVHIHNRMWICAYAAEQAVSGHIQPDPELLFAGKMVSERSESDTQRSVCIRGETVYFTGQVLWELRFPRAMTSAGRCLICGRSRRRKGCWIKSPA